MRMTVVPPQERLKDRIITKCYHLFCSECVDENLRSRHRKCPACGQTFGAGDVKPVYLV
jgi:E3 ubiquitin-protein ligase BRE1